MGKCFKNIFSESSIPIENKHCMDGHWIDLYKSDVFCADWKFKMAAISGHSFIIGRYEEKCVKISALAPVNQSKANIAWMVLEWIFTKFMFFCVDRIFKMGTLSEHSLT